MLFTVWGSRRTRALSPYIVGKPAATERGRGRQWEYLLDPRISRGSSDTGRTSRCVARVLSHFPKHNLPYLRPLFSITELPNQTHAKKLQYVSRHDLTCIGPLNSERYTTGSFWNESEAFDILGLQNRQEIGHTLPVCSHKIPYKHMAKRTI